MSDSNIYIYQEKKKVRLGAYEDVYTSVDEIAKADLVDNINLCRDWNKIMDIVVNGTFSVEIFRK